MQYPKITIITPSYNQAQYIEQTIDSVLSQKYPNLEYFIFDGGSKDASAEVIARYEKHLAYWQSAPDKGQTDAINKGLARSTGDIVNWLNSDDYYEPNALFEVADAFMRTNAQVVCGRSRIFKGEETLFYSNGTDIYPENLAKTIGWARIDQPETFFGRQAIKEMGTPDVRFQYLMDRDWWIKYLLHFGLERIEKIDNVLVNFRHHEQSKTISQQSHFEVERNSLFVALADFYACEDIATFMRSHYEVKPDFRLASFPTIDTTFAKQFLHYYLLLTAEELYVKREHAKAKIILSFIDKHCLHREDIKLYKKIRLRNAIRTWL